MIGDSGSTGASSDVQVVRRDRPPADVEQVRTDALMSAAIVEFARCNASGEDRVAVYRAIEHARSGAAASWTAAGVLLQVAADPSTPPNAAGVLRRIAPEGLRGNVTP